MTDLRWLFFLLLLPPLALSASPIDAEELSKTPPPFYENELEPWLTGAAYHLEDWPRARDALEIFVRYGNDQLEQAEAKELLDEVRRKLGAGGSP